MAKLSQRTRLEERTRLNAQVVEHMQIGLIVFRLERPDEAESLRLIVANRAAAAFTDSDLDTLLGKTIFEAFPNLRGTGLPEMYRDGAQHKTSRYAGEFPYVDEHSESAFYSLQVFPLPDSSVGVAFEDVTERKRKADAQAQAHERFAKSFHSSSTALAISRVVDGTFLDLNEAYERLFGYRREQVIGLMASELDIYMNSAERDEMMRLLREEEAIRDYAITVHSQSGQVRDVLCSLEPIHVGGEACTLASIVDITELKRTELELRTRERRVVFLAEASAVLASALDYEKTLTRLASIAVPSMGDWCAVHVVDDDGAVRELAVAHVDPTILRLAHELRQRYPETQAADQGVYRVVRTGKPELMGIVTDAALVASAQDGYHVQLLRKLGVHSVLVVPIRTRDHIQGAITLVSTEPGRYSEDDIPLMEDVARRAATAIDNAHLYQEAKVAAEAMSQLNLGLEQRVAERTREIGLANQQLSTLNHELETFAYSVSHDLRAPLRHIDGFSKALATNYAAVLDERGLHYLQRIRTGTQRMGELIDDLLQLSRVTRTEVRYADVDLSALARHIASELQSESAERPVTWTIADTSLALGDERLLGIVLNNLLSNAWKFTGHTEGAQIEFSSELVHGEVVYVVRDNGAGFNMAYADKLFGVFKRLHSNDEFEGSGVGLATAQRIVHRHGGRIWAHGVVGQGASVSFTLHPAS